MFLFGKGKDKEYSIPTIMRHSENTGKMKRHSMTKGQIGERSKQIDQQESE